MTDRKRLIAPSVLAADFAEMGKSLSIAENAGADWIHLDIMDGVFVPPITFGAQMVAAIHSRCRLPLDAHLMTVEPSRHVDSFAEAGVDRLTFHIEAEIHSNRLINSIKDKGMKAGISIVPSTPVDSLSEILDIVDQVLVMTVNPGYGGQKFIETTLNKIRQLKQIKDERGLDFLIAMDGGFGASTASRIWEAGTDVAVMGSAFFGASNPEKALKDCREAPRDFAGGLKG